MSDGRYLSVHDYKLWTRDEVVAEDDLIGDAIAAAEQALDNACSRRFEVASASTARVYRPPCGAILRIDDCTAVASIANNGTTLNASTYQLEPLNNLSTSGDWRPYDAVRRLSGSWASTTAGEASVTVTATWGWSAIPPGVIESCKIVTQSMLEARDLRFGLAAVTEGGAVGDRERRVVMKTIADYNADRGARVA